jgi:hypothetical protein
MVIMGISLLIVVTVACVYFFGVPWTLRESGRELISVQRLFPEIKGITSCEWEYERKWNLYPLFAIHKFHGTATLEEREIQKILSEYLFSPVSGDFEVLPKLSLKDTICADDMILYNSPDYDYEMTADLGWTVTLVFNKDRNSLYFWWKDVDP